jgi:hypothetical protein
MPEGVPRMKVMRFEVSVETDDDVPAKAVRDVMTNHLWFALEDVGAGRINWLRTLRMRALLMIAPDDQVRAQQQMQEAMDIAALFGR